MIDEPSASDLPIAVFYRSIPKTIAIFLLWSALTALGAAIVLGCIANFAATADEYVPLVLWLVVCGLALALVSGFILFSHLVKVVRVLRGPIIEVSHVGLRDRRIAPYIIPWSAIESLWRLSQVPRLLLILDPAVDNSLPRSAFGTWARRQRIYGVLKNRLSGGDDYLDYGHGFGDVSIGMLEIDGSFDALVRAVEQAWGAIEVKPWGDVEDSG